MFGVSEGEVFVVFVGEYVVWFDVCFLVMFEEMLCFGCVMVLMCNDMVVYEKDGEYV